VSSTTRIRNWELAGLVAICGVGSAWHFLFGWSGYWRPIAWLAPVNESVWEHFKMAFWPGLIWACVAYGVVGQAVKNYWFARICGLWCMPIVIAAISYGYTAALGRRYLWVDILSFLVAVAAGQLVSFKLFHIGDLGLPVRWLGIVGILSTMVVFVLFTYMPPHLFIFEQLQTHEYGILAHY
jgi:hypothetical protein